MEQLSAKIKRFRIAKELTQEALGNAVGVSRVAVTKWENGDTENLKLANLKRLCEVFGVSVAELIDAKADYILAGQDGSITIVEAKTTPGVRQEHSDSYGAAIGVAKTIPFSDPDINAVVELMKNTDKTGRSIALVQVKLALAAYQPAKAKPAS